MKKSTYLFLVFIFAVMVLFGSLSVIRNLNSDDGDEHVHTIVIDEAVAATCMEDGLTEGSHCSECGEVIVAQEVIPAGYTIVYAIENVIEPTCTKDGYYYIVGYCSECGIELSYEKVILEATGHDLEYIEEYDEYCCTICGYTEDP